MTLQSPPKIDQYLEAFDAFESNGASGDPSFVKDLRRDAIGRFRELGLPTARRGNEEWKYTDVRPIANAALRPLPAVDAAPLAPAALVPFSFGESAQRRIVFVDGRFSPALSTRRPPEGVTLANLADVIRASPEIVSAHLGRRLDYRNNGFAALNTAFVHEGAFLHIADGAVVDEPLHIVFLATDAATGWAVQPRVLVVAGRGSQATVVESYGGIGGGPYLTNAITEVVVGDDAGLTHYRVQREGEAAFSITNTQVELGRDARYASVVADLGGKLVRNNLSVVTADQGCYASLDGLYVVTGSQHVDNQVIIDHAMPHTNSRELYKGVLSGKSRTVFHGSIIVRPGAQKVNANQADKNLLLSDEAEADTKPAFWIYADDVRCGHGAACGRLDESALFYLRSRGIGEEEARAMLTRAFVNEIVEAIAHEGVRAYVDGLVSDKLQGM